MNTRPKETTMHTKWWFRARAYLRHMYPSKPITDERVDTACKARGWPIQSR